MQVKPMTYQEVNVVIEQSEPGFNTKFLANAAGIWRHYGLERDAKGVYVFNPETSPFLKKQPPWGLFDEKGDAVCIVFATFGARGKYSNLYEIGTVQGKEGHGYASQLWDWYVDYTARVRDIKRVRISCTPRSLGWHLRNGNMYWSVDGTGSLRCDMPVFDNRKDQLAFREKAVKDPSIAFPNTAEMLKLAAEDYTAKYKFSQPKTERTLEAIKTAGKYWLRDAMVNYVNEEKL